MQIKDLSLTGFELDFFRFRIKSGMAALGLFVSIIANSYKPNIFCSILSILSAVIPDLIRDLKIGLSHAQ